MYRRTLAIIVVVLMVGSSLGLFQMGVNPVNNNRALKYQTQTISSDSTGNPAIPTSPVFTPTFSYQGLNSIYANQTPVTSTYGLYNTYSSGSTLYLVDVASNQSTYVILENQNHTVLNTTFVSPYPYYESAAIGDNILISVYNPSNFQSSVFLYASGTVTNVTKSFGAPNMITYSVGGVLNGSFIIVAWENNYYTPSKPYVYLYNYTTGLSTNISGSIPAGINYDTAYGVGNTLALGYSYSGNSILTFINFTTGKTENYYFNSSGGIGYLVSNFVDMGSLMYISVNNFDMTIYGSNSTFILAFNSSSNQLLNITQNNALFGNLVVPGLGVFNHSIWAASGDYSFSSDVLNYYGSYLYRIYGNGTVANETALLPKGYEQSVLVSSGSTVNLYGSNLNGSGESIAISSNLSVSVSYGVSIPLYSANPSFWTANLIAESNGFLITGGNGFMGFGNGKFYAPSNETTGSPGFFTGATQYQDSLYVTGQLYAPRDGALLYRYNLSSGLMNNITSVPLSLEEKASFLQDLTVGSMIYIMGETGENTNSSPSLILYAYNTTVGSFVNITQNIPDQYRSIYLGSFYYYSDNLYFLIIGENGTNFFSLSLPSLGFTSLNSVIPTGFQIQYGVSYTPSKQLIKSYGSTLYLTGNLYGGSQIALISYNTSTGKSQDLSSLVKGYSATVTSATIFNGMFVIGGYNQQSPVLLGVSLSTGYPVYDMSSTVPTGVSYINSISGNSTSLMIAGGQFGNVYYGLITEKILMDYPVVFNQNSLPSSTGWTVSIGGTTNYSTGNLNVIYLPNGTYSYKIGSITNFASNPSSGQFTVNGNYVEVNVTWLRQSYTATFEETGLSVGASWAVSINGKTVSSTSKTIGINLRNGTYMFTVTPPSGYLASPAEGNITIAGNSLTIQVLLATQNDISKGYVLTNLSSEYLSQGLFWTSQSTYGAGYTGIAGGNGFITSTSPGQTSVAVNANLGYTNFVEWTGVSFLVGGNWYNPSGGVRVYQYYPSNGTLFSITSELPLDWTVMGNGNTLISMAYGQGALLLVKDQLFSGTPSIGLYTHGSFTNITSEFSGLGQSLYVSEYGGGNFLLVGSSNAYIYDISSNTIRTVSGFVPDSIANGMGTTSQIAWNGTAFLVANGNSMYSINPTSASENLLFTVANHISFVKQVGNTSFYDNYNGIQSVLYSTNGSTTTELLTVNGQVNDVSAAYHGFIISGVTTFPVPLVYYYQPISETSVTSSGLSAGTAYEIKGDNYTAVLYAGSSQAIYSVTGEHFEVVPPTGYSVSPGNFYTATPGTSGSVKAINIAFTKEPTYGVNFSESGLPPGMEWNITINGITYSTTERSLTIPEINGSYNYSISPSNYYDPFPSTGSFIVDDKIVTVPTISFGSGGTYSVSFVESGLASGTPWSVTYNGLTKTSTNENILFTSQTGTFSYSISNIAGYITTVTSGNISVSANYVQPVQFIPVSGSVTFSETGLSGQNWGVIIGGTTYSTSGNTLSVGLATGTYQYSVVLPTGYSANVTGGNVTLSGSNVNIFLNISPVNEYAATFTETGLPNGTSWAVSLSGTTMNSNLSHMTFDEPVGIYSYNISSVNGYSSNITSGYISLNGTSVNINVNFTYQFNATSAVLDPSITFTESGLALTTGGDWSVTLGNTTKMTGTSQIQFQATSGTYQYTVSKSGTYFPIVESGTVTLSGNPVDISVQYIQISYSALYVNTTGIGQQTLWTLQVGTYTFNLAGSSIVHVPTGSYQYHITDPSGYQAMYSTGYLDLSGSTSSLSVTFQKIVAYDVEFNSVGLQAGSTWGIDIGGVSYHTTSNMLDLPLANGTYSYDVIGTNSVVPVYSSGTFFVSGQQTNVQKVYFTSYLHIVEFNESGLPSGMQWSITIDGVTHQTIFPSIFITLPAGDYSYNISNPANYTSTNTIGTVDLTSGNSLQTITFSSISYYEVTFNETGLSNGTLWYIHIDGENLSSSGHTISLQLKNGTYGFTLPTINGMVPVTPSGNITVSGHGVVDNITYSQVHILKNLPPIGSLYLYVFAGIAIAIVLVAVSVIIILRRRSQH